jgi:hypothetical protein
MDRENRPNNEKTKSTVISVALTRAPEKSDYMWTRRTTFGTSDAFSGVEQTKMGRTFFFFFALLMIGYQNIERCRSEELCKPKLRSQVSDRGGETAERQWRNLSSRHCQNRRCKLVTLQASRGRSTKGAGGIKRRKKIEGQESFAVNFHLKITTMAQFFFSLFTFCPG